MSPVPRSPSDGVAVPLPRPRSRTDRLPVRSFARGLGLGTPGAVAAAALAALLVLPLGLADGGYFGRSLTAMVVALGTGAGLAVLGAPSRALPKGLLVAGIGLAALTAWVALSSLWAPPGAAVGVETKRCVAYVAALLAVWRVVGHRLRRTFLLALASSITILAVVGLVMRASSGVPVDPYYGGLLAEPVGYPNAIGVLAAIGAVLAIGLAAAPSRALQAVASVLVLVLGLSGSRGGALALLAGLGVLLVLSTRPARWPGLGRAVTALVAGGGAWALTLVAGGAGAPLLVAAACAAAVGAVVPPMGRRGALVTTCVLALALCAVAIQQPPSTTSSYRSAYWRAALAEARERPLLGSGAGSFFLSWQEHRTADTDVRDAHSLYVETLSELGPIGLVLVLVVVAAPLGAAVRRRGDPLVASAAAGFAVFVLHAGLDWDWEMPVVTLVAFGCAGVVLAGGRPSSVRRRQT
jgi:O-antigen ligase